MPAIPPVHTDSIPASMRDQAHFVLWRYERDEEATGDEVRWRKVPVMAKTLRRASSTMPVTWTTYSAAASAYTRATQQAPNRYGLGFVFAKQQEKYSQITPADSDDLTFIDLDQCRDPDSGMIEPRAWELIRRVNTYAEASPSGTGVHLYVRGRCARAHKVGHIEIYSVARFGTLTGQHLDDTPVDIMDGQDALDELIAHLQDQIAAAKAARNGPHSPHSTPRQQTSPRPVTPVRLTDTELLRRIRASKQGPLFQDLYDRGTWQSRYPSQSEAVWALLRILAFWTQCDGVRMDRLFRLSALMSGTWEHKWDDTRQDSTLGEQQILKMIEQTGDDVYAGLDGGAEVPGAGINLLRASDVVERPLFWLWKNYIPLGKAVVLDGEPDLGKSAVTIDLTARVTQSQQMPDGSRSELDGAHSVIIASCEDDPADTVVPRLRLAGADLTRVHLLTDVTLDDGTHRPFTIPHDLPLLHATVLTTGARLVIIDPLVGFLDEAINSHNDAQMRRALAPLHQMAQESGAAIVAIRHFTKDRSQTNLLHRGGGSIGIIGAMRGGLAILPDPDPTQRARRYFGATKHNLGAGAAPTLVYQVTPVTTTIAGMERELPVVHWLGSDPRSLDELNRIHASSTTGDAPTKGAMGKCFAFLEVFLSDGAWQRSAAVAAAALADGHSERTFRRCREQWIDIGRIEQRKIGAKKHDDGTTEGSYWEMRLVTEVPISIVLDDDDIDPCTVVEETVTPAPKVAPSN